MDSSDDRDTDHADAEEGHDAIVNAMSDFLVQHDPMTDKWNALDHQYFKFHKMEYVFTAIAIGH